MGLLDLLTQPSQSFYGLLNSSAPDDAALNSVPGFSMRAPDASADPFADLDKKQREELAKKAAAGVFATGAPPVPQAGVSGQQVAQPGPFGALSPAPQPVTPSIAPAPVASAAALPVPLPQPRPAIPAAASGPAIDQTTLPQNATPTQGQLPPAQSAAAPSQPGLGDRLNDFIDTHRGQLMGLAGGLAGAPSLGAGIGRGFTAAAAALPADQKAQLLGASNTAMLKAFQEAKVPSALAQAALTDPTIRKSVAENYLGDRKSEMKSIDLPNGTKMSVLHNPYTNSVTDLQGKPIDLNNISGGAIDPNLTGEEARAAAEKSDPTLLRQAQNYVSGAEMLPSGRSLTNPRLKAAVDLARQLDPELTDNVSQARTAYMKDVGNTKNGVGFQVKGFQQGAEHLNTMAKEIEKYAPSDGGGSADLAHAVNSVKQRFGASSGLARAIDTEGQAAAGEMGKLYSGQSGGGVHERQQTADRFKTGNSSATELAGSLESTADLMEGGLRSIEQNRDRVMGEHGSKLPQVQYRNPETQAKLDEVRAIARRLRGEEAPAASAPASNTPALKPGNYVYDPKTKQFAPQ